MIVAEKYTKRKLSNASTISSVNDSMSNGKPRERRVSISSQAPPDDKLEQLGAGRRRASTLQKNLTLVHAVAIIVGAVIGSGIFVSPKGVVRNVKSVGFSLVLWVLCGVHQLCLAMCYGELGTMLPKAGGDYFYIHDILGPLPGFLILWINSIMIAPIQVAVIARTAGEYVLAPFFPNCGAPIALIMLVAVWVALAFTVVNSSSVEVTAKLQTIFSLTKVVALGVIIVIGIVQLIRGRTENFQTGFQNTDWNPGAIALAVFAGVFSYAGWEAVATIAEEMINPVRDLPLAIIIGMMLAIFINFMTNVAYFTVLSPEELIASPAVALTFGEKTIGQAAVIISVFVFLSCSGTVNGSFMANPRITFAGARAKQIPQVLGYIHHEFMTPIPAIVIQCVLGCAFACVPSVSSMMDIMVINSLFRWILALSALLYLRWKKPDMYRPLKVPLPIVLVNYLLVCLLVIFGIIQDPITNGIGAAIFFAGVPMYFLSALCFNKDGCHHGCIDKLTAVIQQFLCVVPEEGG